MLRQTELQHRVLARHSEHARIMFEKARSAGHASRNADGVLPIGLSSGRVQANVQVVIVRLHWCRARCKQGLARTSFKSVLEGVK